MQTLLIVLVEIQRQFENCQPKFVITDSEHVGKILEIAKNVHSIQVYCIMFINTINKFFNID